MKKILILLAAAVATAAFATAPAHAGTVSCVFAAHVATVETTGDEYVEIRRSGTAIVVNGAPCGAATVTSTDTVIVNGSGVSDGVVLDLAGGPFEPGAAFEVIGTPEIEFQFNLGDGDDDLLVTGSVGDDTLILGTAGMKLNADADVDVTVAGLERMSLWPIEGSDTVSAAGDAQTGAAWPTAVMVGSGPGDDTVTGGGGDDALYGHGGNDTLTGGPGNDLLISSEGADSIDGGAGDDTVSGGLDNDMLLGGDDDDTFIADGNPDGDDAVAGGNGFDHADYSYRWSTVKISLDGAANDGAPGLELDNIAADVEALTGGFGNDTLSGTEAANHLVGGDGADELAGRAGYDSLEGGEGADVLNGGGDGDFLGAGPAADTVNGGAGGDIVNSGPGNDTVNLGGDNDIYVAEANDGADSVSGGAGPADLASYGTRDANLTITLDGVANDGRTGEYDNIATDVEKIAGGAGDDTLIGSSADNELEGLLGNDTLEGGAGSDTLLAGGGDDALKGGDGYDELFGEAGADRFRLADGGMDHADGGSDAKVDAVLNKDATDVLVNFP